MEVSNINLGDERILGDNEEVLGAQRPLALDGGQSASSGIRPGGDAPEDSNVEFVPHSEIRKGDKIRRPSSRSGPRCAKEGRKVKEEIFENRRRETKDSRRKRREEDIEGRRAISPTDPETVLSVRTMSRASRAPSSTSTIYDVSDDVLGEMEDLPATAKKSPREVSPGTFPRASIPAASGSRGRGRSLTTGEYVGYAKAQREANEAKRKALDMEAKAAVSRSGWRRPAKRKGRRRGLATDDGCTPCSPRRRGGYGVQERRSAEGGRQFRGRGGP